MYGVECGRHCVVHGKLYVHLFPSAKVKIGDNLYFSSGWGINALCANKRGMIYATHDACISIGDNVGMSSTVLWSHKKITIGNHVKIGGNCILIDTDAHNMDFLLRRSPSIIRKSKFPQNPKRSVRFSGKRTKRSVQKRKARNTQKAETKVL